jgi:HPt (histidine-containing phosphotransfer) domain-containing protein
MINKSALIALLESEYLVDKFIKNFKAHMPSSLQEIEALILTNDAKSLSDNIHGLKSQLKYLGLDSEYELAQKIEHNCDTHSENNWNKIKADYDKLKLSLLNVIESEI